MGTIRPNELDLARRAGRIAAETIMLVGEHIRPGITTDEINTLVHDYAVSKGARSAPLGYGGTHDRVAFPKSVCTSVNECVCHGIPESRVLQSGDIVNVDVTPVFPAKNGFHGDCSVTFYVGTPTAEAKHVVEVARQSLEIGLAQVRSGRRLGDIGAAIQAFAEAEGCSVVRDYTGHGTGRTFHDSPSVHHFGVAGTGPKLKRGMCFTIEPMINLGGYEVVLEDDDWTVVTKDGSLSAQFEHTIVVTKNGFEVLTRRPGLVKNCEDVPWAKLGPLASAMGSSK